MVLIQTSHPSVQMGTLKVASHREDGSGPWVVDSGVPSFSFHPLQVGNVSLILFVSYFGSRVHRPRMIGYGALLVATAGLLMALPHFISEPYRYDHSSSGKRLGRR